MVGNRRRARESALQLLYQDEFHEPAGRRVAERYYWEEAEEAPARKPLREFAARIVAGVREKREAIDDHIRRVARNWKIERMGRVDRNILRMATYELLFVADIPPKVSLNEAIEIAKAYGTEDSSAFINGILDRISRDLQKKTGGRSEDAMSEDDAEDDAGDDTGDDTGDDIETGEASIAEPPAGAAD